MVFVYIVKQLKFRFTSEKNCFTMGEPARIGVLPMQNLLGESEDVQRKQMAWKKSLKALFNKSTDPCVAVLAAATQRSLELSSKIEILERRWNRYLAQRAIDGLPDSSEHASEKNINNVTLQMGINLREACYEFIENNKENLR